MKEKAWAEAGARLARLQEAPRQEEIPPARARVQEAEALLEDLRLQLKAAEGIGDPRAISREDLNKRRYAVQAAEARLTQARTNLELLTAGTWKADLEVARAEVERAAAEVRAARVEIERLTVRAPVAGHVLQVNIRPGEFAAAGPAAQPLMLLGDLDRLQVRVDIDENDAWRFQPGLAATAFVRGNPRLKTSLSFEYVEPYVIPKKSLTGDSTERVDTRVMQVVYSFSRTALAVYPGQLMDVYIEDRSGPAAPKTNPPSGQRKALNMWRSLPTWIVISSAVGRLRGGTGLSAGGPAGPGPLRGPGAGDNRRRSAAAGNRRGLVDDFPGPGTGSPPGPGGGKKS